MNRTVAPLVAALLAAACASTRPASTPATPAADRWAPAAAAPAPAAPAESPAVGPIPLPAGPLTRVGGIAVSGNASAHTITLKDYHGRTLTFRIADSARMTKGGSDSPVTLNAIASGDRVRLEVGGDVAASVHVLVKPVS